MEAWRAWLPVWANTGRVLSPQWAPVMLFELVELLELVMLF